MIPLRYRFSRKDVLSNTICFAAERNLFIGSDGTIGPCCFNRKDVFGNINNNSFEEITQSEVRRNLNNKLRKAELGAGCFLCNQAIRSRNYKAAGSLNYDLIIGKKKHFPLFIEFELDTFCNLNCIMCPPELHSDKPQSLFDSGFVEKITPLLKDLKWTKFYGGEPFLIGIYYDIWDRIISVNPSCKITVQTNATIYNEKVKQLLERGNFRLSVSLDSLKPENYEKIRIGASFGKVMENLNHFIEYSRIHKRPLNLAVCPMTNNLHDIPELVQFANKNALFIYFNLLLYPRNLSPKYLSAKEIDDAIIQFKKCKFSLHNRVSGEIRRHLNSLTNQFIEWRNEAIEKEKIPVIEIDKKELLNILCFSLNSNAHKDAEQKLVLAFSKLEDNLRIRKDTLQQIKALNSENILHFILSKNNEKLTESIKDIINFGF